MSDKSAGISGIKWNAIGSWAGQLIGLAIFTALSRLLMPDAFGLVALASVYIGFVELFVSQGLGMAVIQRKDLQPEHLDSAFWLNIASSVVIAVVSFLASGPIAVFMGDPALQPYIAALSVTFILAGLVIVQNAILMREMMFDKMTIRKLVSQLVGGATGIGMAIAGFGPWSLVVQAIVTQVISTVTIWAICSWRPGFRISWKHIVELWRYSWAILVGKIMGFFSTRTDQFLIGRAIGTVSLAYYSIAQKIISILIQGLTQPITYVSVPLLSKNQDDKDRIVAVMRHGIEMSALFCFPIFFGLICLAPDAVSIVFGERWITSAYLLRIMLVGEIVNMMVVFNTPIFFSLAKPHYNLWTLFAKALGVVPAALIGVRWGMEGIAVGIAINCFANALVSTYLVKKIVPFSFLNILSSSKVPLLGSIFMSAGVLLLYNAMPHESSKWVKLGSCVAIGIVLYVPSIYIFSRKLFKEAIEYALIMAGRKGKQKAAT